MRLAEEFQTNFAGASGRPGMPKPRRPKSVTNTRPSAPPPLFPVVTKVRSGDFKISDDQFADLEKAGNIKLSKKQRTKLSTLADFWIGDLRIRRSARPKQFRKCFDKIIMAFSRAEEACRLNESGDINEQHLLQWILEAPVKDATMFPVKLAGFELEIKAYRNVLVGLRDSLPLDPGWQRPFYDARRIIFLADIFKEAGGKPVAYAGGYLDEGSMTDTPFRRFAQHFYSLLPADDKRAPGGLDDALRGALAIRRGKRAHAS
jgi:hypothetical protein